jgi:hypothetical protein
MATTLFIGHTATFICKQLSKLPLVVSEWQQSCKQPRCSHYCDGMCCNPGRLSASAPCPFDGKEFPLVEAEAVYFDDDDFLQPLPQKMIGLGSGQGSAHFCCYLGMAWLSPDHALQTPRRKINPPRLCQSIHRSRAKAPNHSS